MKLTISTDKLLEGLQTVQNVVTTRTTLPILSNVLLQASEEGVVLTTTNLDVLAQGVVEAKVEKPGSTTLPARRLFTIVRQLPVGDVSIEVDSKNIASIRSGKSFFKIHGLPEEEFPPKPEFTEAKDFTVSQKELHDALKKTNYAISNDETRHVLNGTLLSFKENKLTLVATDGRRLALVDIELEFPRSSEVDVILPLKAVNELTRLLGDEGTVQVSVGNKQISFQIGKTLLVSKLVEGNYPNYRQVIPGTAVERITLERELFLQAVQRVSVLVTEKNNSVKLIFDENNIDIVTVAPEIGEAKESFAIQYSGKPFTVSFNPEFLMAPLRNLAEDTVFFDIIDEMSPCVMKLKTPFLYVLMPMRSN